MNRRLFVSSWAAAATSAGTSAAEISLAAAMPPRAAEGPLVKVGASERDITPDIGMEQPGGYGKAYLKKFHDPCKVRAAVFDDGSSRAALVGVDALVVPREVVAAAREAIRKQCGIAPECVLIGASHSHSSGPVGMVMPGEYDHASEFVRKLAYEQSSMADPVYLERVRNGIIDAVVTADRSRAPSWLSFGSGHEDRVAFNRRFRMKNGRSWTHPGQGNPDILEPAGPIDPAVGVIGIWDGGGRLKGCIVNYACHATTSPDGISANWIFYMESAIRATLGKTVVVVFLQGFSGDVTQVDNRSPYRNPSGDDYARLVGGRVGMEAVKVLLGATPGYGGPVAAASRLEVFNRRLPSPERLKRCFEIMKQDPREAGLTEWIFAKEIVMLDAQAARTPKLEAEVQAIQVGPVAAIAAPGEMFCQFGLDLRAESPFPLTFPVELANGCVGYVPTEEALGPRGGGYETRLTSYSSIEPSAGRRMVATGLALVRGFTPGALPEPLRASPFNPDPSGIGPRPWSYGNVPPELS